MKDCNGADIAQHWCTLYCAVRIRALLGIEDAQNLSPDCPFPIFSPCNIPTIFSLGRTYYALAVAYEYPNGPNAWLFIKSQEYPEA